MMRGTCALVAMLGGCALAGPGQRTRADADEGGQHQTDAPSGHPMPDAPPASGCAQQFTGVLATWDFSAAAGNQASTAAASAAPGIVAGVVTRSSGLTAASGAASINSSSWPTAAALDATKYYTLTVAPPSGCSMAISSVALDAKASGTGPSMGSIASSSNSFANPIAISTSAPGTPSLVVAGQTTSLEIRVYGYSASSASGTLRIQNTLSISGSLH